MLLSDGFREWLEEAPEGLFGPAMMMLVGGLVLLAVGVGKWRSPERGSARILIVSGAGVVALASVRLLAGL